jgi:hypothetical protein
MKIRPPKTIGVSPEHLEFDDANPRLVDADEAPPKTEKDMVGWLWRHADVQELVTSIAQSGWMPFDDMVVLKTAAKPDKFVVLEGNRRLAALKLFTNDKLATELAIKLPPISKQNRETLEEIEVKEVANREAARAFIGFKHVNGPHKWDAFAKAKFATEWLDAEGDLNTIALTLGDNNNTVRRLVVGYRVLEQAKKERFRPENSASPRGFAFSHLYTALGQTGYQTYLGIDYNSPKTLTDKAPIPKNNLPNLADVLDWLYGDKSQGIEPVIRSQNPDLGHLNRVLAKSAALNILKSSRNLDAAYEEVESKSVRFVSALVSAYQAADNALKLSSSYDGVDTSVSETSSNLLATADTLNAVVTRKIEQKKAAPSKKATRKQRLPAE